MFVDLYIDFMLVGCITSSEPENALPNASRLKEELAPAVVNQAYADNVEKLLKFMKDLDLKVEDQTRLIHLFGFSY